MNQHPGVIGRKVGMTQVIDDEGVVIPCTVVHAATVVVDKRTQEANGYNAVVLGHGVRKEKHTSRPLAGYFKKAGVAPVRSLRELRCSAEALQRVEAGKPLNLAEVFEAGQIVDVRGVSRGRGFSGVMRRHNFAGGGASHGAHEYKRHGGSIGTNMTPGRVLKGVKMPGQLGNKQVAVLNQRVVKVMPEENLLLIRGAIPGGRNSLVEIRGAVKKRAGGKAS